MNISEILTTFKTCSIIQEKRGISHSWCCEQVSELRGQYPGNKATDSASIYLQQQGLSSTIVNKESHKNPNESVSHSAIEDFKLINTEASELTIDNAELLNKHLMTIIPDEEWFKITSKDLIVELENVQMVFKDVQTVKETYDYEEWGFTNEDDCNKADVPKEWLILINEDRHNEDETINTEAEVEKAEYEYELFTLMVFKSKFANLIQKTMSTFIMPTKSATLNFNELDIDYEIERSEETTDPDRNVSPIDSGLKRDEQEVEMSEYDESEPLVVAADINKKHDADSTKEGDMEFSDVDLNLTKNEESECTSDGETDGVVVKNKRKFAVNKWMNSNNETVGATLNSKKSNFKEAANILENIWVEGWKKKVGDIKIGVEEVDVNGTSKVIILYIEGDVDKVIVKGEVTVTIYKSKKKGVTFKIDKIKKNYVKLVDMASNVICKLLDAVISGGKIEDITKQPKDVPCDVCGKMFANKTNAKIHRTRLHKTKNRNHGEICPECNVCLQDKVRLHMHVKSHHKNNSRGENVQCDVCGVLGIGSLELKKHRRDWHGDVIQSISPPKKKWKRGVFFDTSEDSVNGTESNNKTEDMEGIEPVECMLLDIVNELVDGVEEHVNKMDCDMDDGYKELSQINVTTKYATNPTRMAHKRKVEEEKSKKIYSKEINVNEIHNSLIEGNNKKPTNMCRKKADCKYKNRNSYAVSAEEKEKRMKLSDMKDKEIERKRTEDERVDKAKKEYMGKHEDLKENGKVRSINGKKESASKSRKKVSTEIPNVIEELVGIDAAVVEIESNGACGTTAIAKALFDDDKEGITIRRAVNRHVVDEFEYYREKGFGADEDSPFERLIGVGSTSKTIHIRDEADVKKWLLSDEADLMWAQSEDFAAVANLYNTRVHIVTTITSAENKPGIYTINPDPVLQKKMEAIEGGANKITKQIDEVFLLHKDRNHFNVILKRTECDSVSADETRTPDLAEVEKKRKDEIKALKNEINLQRLTKEKYITEYRKMEIMFNKMEENIGRLTQEINKLKEINQIASKPAPLPTDINEGKKCLHPMNTNSDAMDVESEENSSVNSGKARTYSDVTKHNKTEAKKNEEWDCNKCSFQTESEDSIKNHMMLKHGLNPSNTKYKHRRDVNNDDSSEHSVYHDYRLECKDCGEFFISKWKLMQHRAQEHKSSAECWYYRENRCKFNEKCAYTHTKDKTTNKIDCDDCEKLFDTREEKMRHRKKEHIENVKPCRYYYRQGVCNRDENLCWYRHTVRRGDGDKSIYAERSTYNHPQDFQKTSKRPRIV